MKTLTLSIILAAAFALIGCSSCRDAAAEKTFPNTVFHYSSGGGFSGMYSGYSILPDGVVTRWKGFGGTREKSDSVGRIETNDYHEMLNDVYALDPENIHQQETANMTTALQIESGDVTFVYTWPGMHTDGTAVPATVRELRDFVWTRIQKIIPEKE